MENTRTIFLTLLCVIAVSLAAATLTTSQQPSGFGVPSDGPDTSSGAQSPQDDQNSPDSSRVATGWATVRCSQTTIPTTLMYGGLLISFILGIILAYRCSLKALLSATFVLLSLFLLPIIIILGDSCGDPPPDSTGGGGILPPLPATSGDIPSPGSGNPQMIANFILSPIMFLLVLVVFVTILSLIAYFASSGDTSAQSTTDPASANEEKLSSVGSTTLSANTTFNNPNKIDNDIYRAWYEMTTYLSIPNPATYSPAEIAAAAQNAGLNATQVDTLTTLFRNVRYGNHEITEAKEQQAIDALREINKNINNEDN